MFIVASLLALEAGAVRETLQPLTSEDAIRWEGDSYRVIRHGSELGFVALKDGRPMPRDEIDESKGELELFKDAFLQTYTNWDDKVYDAALALKRLKARNMGCWHGSFTPDLCCSNGGWSVCDSEQYILQDCCAGWWSIKDPNFIEEARQTMLGFFDAVYSGPSRNPHHLHASYYAMLMARQAPKDGLVFVEVGVDEGDFFAAVVQEMDWLGVDVKYYAVDPWFGRIEQMKNALNLAIKWAPKVWIIRETGDKASRMLEDESVDFVFIDAVHSFEYVTLHMEKFWPKVKPGGILAGHDFAPEKPQRFPGPFLAAKAFARRMNMDERLIGLQGTTYAIKKADALRAGVQLNPTGRMRLRTPIYSVLVLLGPFLQADGIDGDSNTSRHTSLSSLSSQLRRTQTLGRCYPDNSVSTRTSTYGCHAAKFCSNQQWADDLGTMSLASCMAECDRRWNCEEIQYDCNSDCFLFSGSSCGTLLDTSCGSSYYYKTTTTTTSTTTTELMLGACWPNMLSSTDFRCTASVYCDSQNDGTNYGEIPLEQCVALCRSTFNCNYIQYDCNEVCILLEECHQTRPTVCGSSVYRYENAVDIATSTSTEQEQTEAAEPDPEPVFGMEEGHFGCKTLVQSEPVPDLPVLFLISGISISVLSVFFRCYMQRMRNRSAAAAKFVPSAGSGSVIIGSIGIRTTRRDGEEDLEPLTSMARQNVPRYWSTSADIQEESGLWRTCLCET
eukprot:s615_g16.t1